jgi:HAD superfamily phosphatase (TIGR01668 family)
MLYPDFMANLTKLPLPELRRRGVKVLALDLDHTLSEGRSRVISQGYLDYLRRVRAHGFKLVLASNAGSDVSAIAKQIGAIWVPASGLARKPTKRYFERVIDAAGCRPGEIAMVGDRIINDIVGANRSGLISIKIDPVGRRPSWLQRWYDQRALAQM